MAMTDDDGQALSSREVPTWGSHSHSSQLGGMGKHWSKILTRGEVISGLTPQ